MASQQKCDMIGTGTEDSESQKASGGTLHDKMNHSSSESGTGQIHGSIELQEQTEKGKERL
jgi:hypothetical protein